MKLEQQLKPTGTRCLTFKVSAELYQKLQEKRENKSKQVGVEIQLPDYLRSLLERGVQSD